jgi:hypothetical protein
MMYMDKPEKEYRTHVTFSGSLPHREPSDRSFFLLTGVVTRRASIQHLLFLFLGEITDRTLK